MTPEIVERPSMLLAGIINCGTDVKGINIRNLWHAHSKVESGIENRIEGSWYELHLGEKIGNGVYSVLAAVQIEKLGQLPVEVSLKVLPAGKYAHFVHYMKDGGFDKAFAGIEAWVKENQVKVKDFGLQHYDSNFDPNNKESALHIYIPLENQGN